VDSLSSQLRHSWPQLGRTPGAHQSAIQFAAVHQELALSNIKDLCDLVDTLSVASRTPNQKAEIVARMLEDARDPEIHQALLVTLIPGLHSQNRRLGEWPELQGNDQLDLLIESASLVIHKWAGQTRAYAGPDILDASRQRVRREVLHQRDLHRLEVSLDGTWGGRPYNKHMAQPVVEVDEYRAKIESFVGTDKDAVARMTLRRLYDDVTWTDIGLEFGENRHSAAGHVQDFVTREIRV
jgi:hypothetical protein